ncbi:hypothetical protein Tco_0099595 [Tanacetum coccineum]
MEELHYNQFRGDKLLLLRVLQGLTLQEQVEAILENRGRLFATTAKGKATCPDSAPNQREKGMIRVRRKVVADCNLLTMLLIKLMIWMHLTLIVAKLTLPKVALMAKFILSIGSDALAEKSKLHLATTDDLILSVIEQLKTQVANCTKTNLENKSVNDTLTAELERYKEQVKFERRKNVNLRKHLKEKESLLQTVNLLKNVLAKKNLRNIDREIALENLIKHLDNIKAQQLKPKLYVGDIIVQTNPIMIPDSEETLILAKRDFSIRFVPQTELSVEQAFWSQNSMNSSEPTLFIRPTNVEVPKELPKVCMVNMSLKKLKHHLATFDVVVKERTTPIAITEGCLNYPLVFELRLLQDMTKDRSQLTNFVNKFLGIVKFGNDHVAKIMGNEGLSDWNVTFFKDLLR